MTRRRGGPNHREQGTKVASGLLAVISSNIVARGRGGARKGQLLLLFGGNDKNEWGWGAEVKVALGRGSSNVMARDIDRGQEMSRGTGRGRYRGAEAEEVGGWQRQIGAEG